MFELEVKWIVLKLRLFNWFDRVRKKKWCSYHGYSCPDLKNCPYKKYDEPQDFKECIYCSGLGFIREINGYFSCPICKGKGSWVIEKVI